MKKIFFTLLLGVLVVSCNNNSATGNEDATNNAETSNDNTDVKATYETNAANLEKLLNTWGAQDVEGALSLMADDFTEVGTGMGEPDRTKEEWKANMEMMMGVMKPTLKTAMFLPGVDTTSLAMDGSVRYYGVWNFAAGEKNQDLKVYGSADFNDEGMVSSLTHYADFGMVMMSILPEEIVAQMMGGGE
ncbi:MAG: hypothetical protein ISP70_01885 [Crocinitomicaceae bacterium]|nr:hypothetical protein [Crocinitomicaceae bacterium]